MHRLQISLTQIQYEFLKSEAFVTGKSMAAVLRDLLDEIITTRQQDMLDNDPIWDAIGVGRDLEGPTDISANVNKYLYGERLELTGPSDQIKKVAERPDEYHSD